MGTSRAAGLEGAGAFEALNDPDSPLPHHWTTCNRDYGRFYQNCPRNINVAAAGTYSSAPKRREWQRPASEAAERDMHRLHAKCERKWEMLCRQLEECRAELNFLRQQKHASPDGHRSRTEVKATDKHRSRTDVRPKSSHKYSRKRSDEEASSRNEVHIKLKSKRPEEDEEEDEKCDQCKLEEYKKMLEKSKSFRC